MSLGVKTKDDSTKQTVNSQSNTCCKCGKPVEETKVTNNTQSVSSLNRRSSLKEEDDNFGFKFSKGRFSAQKIDQN